ncbi:NUDIX hydrolase [Haloechinothrix sp. LS1_15]|uniref:NUDIX hydrolase n=1 Tax=Haloechinothrix sp. LS1_15 TaxID=2652248 RepID=UPI002945C0DA|nr:NUDIX hydrolase [Haloechinothrix sp. LS1_15]MDV6011798.1 NUDIX hydrolase [Haloechinothrix sp. LS1_15]
MAQHDPCEPARITTVGTRQVYVNDWMSVREDAIRRQDGSTGIYGVVDKPSYALVIPLDGDRVRLVEQYRYPIGLRRWEFPQGTAPGQDGIAAERLAARELQEETGLLAGTMTELGMLDLAPGLSTQRGHVFLATGLTEGEHAREPEEQDMRSAWFTRSEFEGMITRAELTDAQSIAAYTLLLLHERGGERRP